jgi:hypothetical protein
MLLVLLLLPLSLAIGNCEFDNGGGSGGGGSMAAAAVASAAVAVAVVNNTDGIPWRRWRGHLMATAAFGGIQRQRQWTTAAAYNDNKVAGRCRCNNQIKLTPVAGCWHGCNG